jgi:hypothetical protein
MILENSFFERCHKNYGLEKKIEQKESEKLCGKQKVACPAYGHKCYNFTYSENVTGWFRAGFRRGSSVRASSRTKHIFLETF